MDYQSLIERKLEPIGAMNEDIIYRCPKCEGTTGSGHLYVNYRKRYYNCFRCDLGGKSLDSLLRLLDIDANYDYEKLYNDQEKELDSIIAIKRDIKKKPAKIQDYSKNLDVITSYFFQHTKELSNEAYNYLLSRGLTPGTIESTLMLEGISRYGEELHIGSKKVIGRDYSGRIMIPSLRQDGLISFYVGRDYTGTKSNKYSNAPKEIGVASEDVWGLDIINGDFIIICEGVFTAIAVNNALGKMIACATYGKSIAQKSSESEIQVTSQGEKLLRKNFKTYIMFYDKDALEESIKNAQYLYERGANVRVVKIPEDMYGPHADAADMTREEIIALIKDSIVYNEFSKIDLTL